MAIKLRAKRFGIASALVGSVLVSIACGTSKTNSATTLEDEAESSSLKVTADYLKKFVSDATMIRSGLTSDDKDAVETALRDLGRDIGTAPGSAFGNFVRAVTSNEKIAKSNKLIEKVLKDIAKDQKLVVEPDVDANSSPLIETGIFANGGNRRLLVDGVRAPNNTTSYALWESVLSTNPFDLLALAQDSKAQLVHVEQYISPLAVIAKKKPEGQRVGVVGKTAFITLSDMDSSEPEFMREARGVCSDLETVDGNAVGIETKRTFNFITPTLANAGLPTLGEERSPSLGEVTPNMTSTAFLDMVRKGCLAESNQGGAVRPVKLAYEVVAAFRTAELGTFRILAADLRFGPVGDTNVADQKPARLYWLQRSISNMPAAKK